MAQKAGCDALFYHQLEAPISIESRSASKQGISSEPQNVSYETFRERTQQPMGVLIQMSSGTTGEPKCIDRSWQSIEREIESYLSVFTLPNTMSPIIACPVTHSYGLICGVFVAFARGKTPRVITNINPKYLVNTLQATEKPLLYTSPTMLKGVLRLLPEDQKLHAAMSSGTILPKHTFDEFAPRIEHFFQQYGCSEAGCISINQNMTSAIEVGVPLPHLTLIAGANVGEPAEVVVTTETGQQIHTNDLGYLAPTDDGEAMLSFVSRLDDTIIVAGLNVYPQEVEDLILAHSQVEDAVVFKVEDDYAGQRVGLQFCASETLDTTELRRWCQSHLAHFQVPYHYQQVTHIERLANGKVNRKQIAKAFIAASTLDLPEQTDSAITANLTITSNLTNNSNLTKTELIESIRWILKEQMQIPHIEAFNEDARLNYDLYLDSVLILELILNIETELGFSIPEQALTKENFETVSNLADFLIARQSDEDQASNIADKIEDEQEEFEDIKVHCFVSCICDILKPNPTVDHRPFYFGVWDAEVVINEQHQLDYHSDTINHDAFRHWFKALYSVDITPWYNHQHSKEENLAKLMFLLENKPDHQRVMVMIDMYRLPERENKFNANPFPHYVMLETTEDPNQWLMLDPDFRWEGRLEKDKILHAIESPAVAGGYVFDSHQIQPTSNEAIKAYFEASYFADNNPMTDAVQAVVEHHKTHHQFSSLPDALKQLPVLAIRKYAYEHGLAFFYLALGYDLEQEDSEFETLCVIIEQLVESYKLIQYRAMKLAKLQNADANVNVNVNADSVAKKAVLLEEIDQILQAQNDREFQIKARLKALFEQWSIQQSLTEEVA
jgi:acyl carrier protein